MATPRPVRRAPRLLTWLRGWLTALRDRARPITLEEELARYERELDRAIAEGRRTAVMHYRWEARELGFREADADVYVRNRLQRYDVKTALARGQAVERWRRANGLVRDPG